MANALDILQQYGQQNAAATIRASQAAGLPIWLGAAVVAKESNGRNVYGHDRGGVYSTTALGKPADNLVTENNFREFVRRINVPGAISNGVGPAQITWKGFFPDAEKRGFKLWQPYDNIRYGLELLASYLGGNFSDSSIRAAGKAYNGAAQYGVDLANQAATWRNRLAGAEVPRDLEVGGDDSGFLSALSEADQEFIARAWGAR